LRIDPWSAALYGRWVARRQGNPLHVERGSADEHDRARQHGITFWRIFKLTPTSSFDTRSPTESRHSRVQQNTPRRSATRNQSCCSLLIRRSTWRVYQQDIKKTLDLINYLQTRCLIKSDTRQHRPRAVIKANIVNSQHHLGSSTHTSSRSRSRSPSKSLDTCALCRLCSYSFWYT
jgi:hypothetical protein